MRKSKWLLGLITENPGWKLLSVAIAVVVWGVVANEPELSTFATAGVEYKDMPEAVEISSDPVTTVKLEVRGPSGQLREMASGTRPEVILDMSNVEPGERTFFINDQNIKLARGVKLVRAIPSEVRFRFEPTAQQTVKVTPRFTERVGYEVADFTVSPDAVEVLGPASRVARVQTVRTDAVDIPGSEGSFEFNVNGFVDDPFVRFGGASRFTVKVNIRKK